MMRRFCVLVCAANMMFAAGLNAGEGKSAVNKIIRNIVKAAGGKKAIVKTRSSKMSEKGTYYGMGEGLPYTAEYAIQFPDKFRMEVKGVFVKTINGAKGWTSFMGQTKPMSEKQVKVERQDLYVGEVAMLFPFISPKGYKFKTLAEADGKVGIQVSKKGFPDVKMYFDKVSYHLVKTVHETLDVDNNFQKVTQEAEFGNYKKFDGIPVATTMKIRRNGKRFVEAQVVEFQASPKLDAKTFANP